MEVCLTQEAQDAERGHKACLAGKGGIARGEILGRASSMLWWVEAILAVGYTPFVVLSRGKFTNTRYVKQVYTGSTGELVVACTFRIDTIDLKSNITSRTHQTQSASTSVAEPALHPLLARKPPHYCTGGTYILPVITRPRDLSGRP